MVTVYTGQRCAPCQMLKKLLSYKGVDYIEKPVEDEANAREALSLSGYKIVPVAVIDDEVIVGYNPARVNQLLKTSPTR